MEFSWCKKGLESVCEPRIIIRLLRGIVLGKKETGRGKIDLILWGTEQTSEFSCLIGIPKNQRGKKMG